MTVVRSWERCGDSRRDGPEPASSVDPRDEDGQPKGVVVPWKSRCWREHRARGRHTKEQIKAGGLGAGRKEHAVSKHHVRTHRARKTEPVAG